MTSVLDTVGAHSRRQPSPHCRPAEEICGPLGVKVNECECDEAFGLYDAVGFLDEAQRERLEPHRQDIQQAWTAMLASEQQLRFFYSWGRSGRWALLDSWRSSLNTWTFQHLVANGGATAIRTTLAAALLHGLEQPSATTEAWESWFRPSNTSQERFFSATLAAVGAHGGRADYAYLAVPKADARRRTFQHARARRTSVVVTEVADAPPDLLALAVLLHHPAFPAVSALDSDATLWEISQRYRCVGLNRYRRVFIARDNDGILLGAALAHRGPTGLNVNLLENRCDLLLDTSVETTPVASALMAAASPAYRDFPLPFIPVTVSVDRRQIGRLDEQATQWAHLLHGAVIDVLSQAVWLRPGVAQLVDFLLDSCPVDG